MKTSVISKCIQEKLERVCVSKTEVTVFHSWIREVTHLPYFIFKSRLLSLVHTQEGTTKDMNISKQESMGVPLKLITISTYDN